MFSLELIQAINDWQRGGSARQKQRRAHKLKALAATLDLQFRHTGLCCFRQVALDKHYVWELHQGLGLKETISSWTLTTTVAKEFKGGVPPPEYQGIILAIVPSPESVVLNLDTLFRDQEFLRSSHDARTRITAFDDGIGRYWGSQQEVVLEIGFVPISAVYALGGYSSSRDVIGRMYYGHQPTAEEWDTFDILVERGKTTLGARWLSGEAKDRVLRKTLQGFGILKQDVDAGRRPRSVNDR